MKFYLSIKNAWYGLILLVVFLPFLTLLTWGSLVFHDVLLERSLQQEKVLQEMIHNNVQQEIVRLTTMLENKSDPMAYTLTHNYDQVLLYELLKKVLSREPAIHILLLLKPDGEIITGREIYDVGQSDMSSMQQHWNSASPMSKQELLFLGQGKNYFGASGHHQEGVFLTIAVPVGKTGDEPIAILMAEVDVNILWSGINKDLIREGMISYIVDANGRVLVAPEESLINMDEDAGDLALVSAIVNKQKWSSSQRYEGIQGKKVFGSFLTIESIGWHIVTEIEQESILWPIKELIYKLSLISAAIVVFFLILGMHLVKRVVNTVQLISKDFNRIENQDFSPSKISSPLKELDIMVNGFNRMIKEIARRQQGLNQAAIVFENTSEGIFITNAEPRIVSINNAFTDITGYVEDEVVGKNPSILQSGKQDEDFYKRMWQSIEDNGYWQGELQNRRKNGEIYTELLSINSFKDVKGKVVQYIGVFTDISNIKESEHRLEYLAHHDPLTDLPNRLMCQARMEHELQSAKRHEHQVAVMFIDLDMFKNINDSLGHAFGDQLLKEVTARMNSHLRDDDTIARLGGDEFVLIIGALTNKHDVERFAENVLEQFSRPFVINDNEIFIGASIGISIFPKDGGDVDSLLRNADAAMYKAKAKGRNNYQFYTTDLTSNAYERMSMETYLRHALDKNELVLYYQPQYSLTTGQIVAAEALIRWQHPEQGLIYPDQFIAIAEESGLIVPISEWVIEEACSQLIKWQKAGCYPLRMAVNLSARQFWKPGLAKMVKNVLAKTGVEASRLDLELTESIIMRDTRITEETLNEFHDMGVELSIDDFGTGYSSLSYLKRFPINRLKIDKSFVSDITIERNGDDMINSIIAMGHCMGLQVLAEGVETEEQLIYLKEHGCDEVQGYYYSKPVTADEFVTLYENMRNMISVA